jgi:hypothetical protein
VPTDPRLTGVPAGVQDPLLAQLVALQQRCADLQRQINDLRAAANVQTGSGAPTQPARDGTQYVDTTNLRLYIRANGNWRWLGPFT